MKIIDALKPTGKAIDKRNRDAHIEIRFECGANYLIWVNNKTGEYEGRLAYEAHFIEDWQPYPEAKEIRPEKEGELWKNQTGNYAHTFQDDSGEVYIRDSRMTSSSRVKSVQHIAHNKNGWKRLYPSVEEEAP